MAVVEHKIGGSYHVKQLKRLVRDEGEHILEKAFIFIRYQNLGCTLIIDPWYHFPVPKPAETE